MKQTFAISIGGAAGQGVATPGDIFAKIFSRRGLHLNAYNAYQSIIRGGHTFLTIRTGLEKVTNMGDRLDLLIPLNQDAMNRHLGLLTDRAACIYNADTIKPGAAAEGVALCPLPVGILEDLAARSSTFHDRECEYFVPDLPPMQLHEGRVPRKPSGSLSRARQSFRMRCRGQRPVTRVSVSHRY